MKPKRRPAILLNRVPYDREEVLALHFPSGLRRDAARHLWDLLEESLNVDLRGLHPDDDLSLLGSSVRAGLASTELGSFRHWAEQFLRGADSLDKVEFVMSIEERLEQPWLGRAATKS